MAVVQVIGRPGLHPFGIHWQFRVPPRVSLLFDIVCIGGGERGSPNNNTEAGNGPSERRGGGGGGCSLRSEFPVTPGELLVVACGGGGGISLGLPPPPIPPPVPVPEDGTAGPSFVSRPIGDDVYICYAHPGGADNVITRGGRRGVGDTTYRGGDGGQQCDANDLLSGCGGGGAAGTTGHGHSATNDAQGNLGGAGRDELGGAGGAGATGQDLQGTLGTGPQRGNAYGGGGGGHKVGVDNFGNRRNTGAHGYVSFKYDAPPNMGGGGAGLGGGGQGFVVLPFVGGGGGGGGFGPPPVTPRAAAAFMEVLGNGATVVDGDTVADADNDTSFGVAEV